MAHWKEKYSTGGVCEFRQNYDFYFRWLLNKVASCFVFDGLPDTINQTYLKTELILSGACCITDFGGKLYACTGSLGGKPDEYYIPTVWVIANPVLGSKSVKISGDDAGGVVIWNTSTDMIYNGTFCAGLYQLINQTATLLADNIISINANQINSRVNAFFTADSEAQAIAGETILKKMYAGRPYQILRSDLIEKINVNPVSTASTSSNITELVELHNYIISNFMQSIGIRANNEHKRERMITDEINVQNDYLELSILEMLASWTEGVHRVNEMYSTNIRVTLSPAIADIITATAEQGAEKAPEEAETESSAGDDEESGNTVESAGNNAGGDADGMGDVLQAAETAEAETSPEEVKEQLETAAEIIEEIATAAAGEEVDGNEDSSDLQQNNGENVERNTGTE